ncbi:MAG: bifunctional serine/threonine-protein kinase/ABC transporter substrate-binding protein [Prochloraceae cyanobacterium]|nr:bifunctional serine/threonine-protein kinase/ABC transporter substrate-binding protein [Prochloraceae cyanobacterium]
MSLCINSECTQPENPDDRLFCQGCGSELLIGGKYRVIRLLSSKGGFAQTYEVLDEGKLKVLKALTHNHPQAIELFLREAEVLLELEHSGIPKGEGHFTYSAKNSQTPIHCMVMEKIEGMDLEEYQEQRQNRPVNQKTVLKWLRQITEILDLVHSYNFFHRDIKPSNIILQPDGNLTLIDFGAVRQITNTIIARERSTGVYTPGYAPPEQEKGYAIPQSDFYALGRTMVYLLTGRSPTDITIYDQYNNELKWKEYAINLMPELGDLIGELIAEKARDRPRNTKVILERIKTIEAKLSQTKIEKTATFNNRERQNVATTRASSVFQNNGRDKTQVALLNSEHNSENKIETWYVQNPFVDGTKENCGQKPSKQIYIGINQKTIAAGLTALILISIGAAIGHKILETFPTSISAENNQEKSQTLQPTEQIIPFSQEWWSRGDRVLFRGQINWFRDRGVEAFKIGKYAEALTLFEKGVKSDPRDPEVQIYLNNAKARLAGSPLVIATVIPVDNNQTSAAEMLRGVADAQTQFNDAGGINGRLVEVIVANDGNQPQKSASIAQKIAGDKTILGVIGHNSSSATKAGLLEYEKANLAIISPTSTSDSISGKVFFRTSPSDAASGKQLAIFAVNSLKIKKVAVFYNPNSTYSTSLYQAFESSLQRLGGQIETAIDLSNQDLEPEREIKGLRGHTDAIALFPNTHTTSVAIGIARANDDLPGEKFQLLSGDSLYNASTITSGGRAVEGLTIAVPWFSGKQLYAQKASRRWLGAINWRTATSFDATVALLEALSPNPTRQTVLQKLYSTRIRANRTSGTALKFDHRGEREGDPVIVRVAKDAPHPIQGVELGFKLIQQ